jgi:two-component system sensor histidine kinase DctS
VTVATPRPPPSTLLFTRHRPIDRVIEALPLAAVVAIVLLLGSLVWLADHGEREEARAALVRDGLWVEQALRFQIEADRDALERIAYDNVARPIGPEALGMRLRGMIGARPEIGRVMKFDDEGHLEIAQPPIDPAIEVAVPPDSRMRGFGFPREAVGFGRVVDLVVPIRTTDTRFGTLVAVIRLDRLLNTHVPWWITQNGRVALRTHDGLELAARSSVDPGPMATRWQHPFDPPLPGVDIVVVAQTRSGSLARNALVAAILGFAAVAIVSLIALTRHWRRRLVAEQNLREAEALRRSMEESLTVGLRARDLDGRIIYVNPAFCRMVGFSAEDLVGHGQPMPYWPPDLVAALFARHRAMLEGRLDPSGFETRFRRSDGALLEVVVYEAPLVDAEGIQRGWMGSIIDVTEARRAAERERLQTETLTRSARLVSMGEMASTLAHELNQPLAAITSYAAGCLNLIRDGRVPANMAEALEKLEIEARRAGAIVRRVGDFVRRRDPVLAPLDLADLFADLAGFVAADARKTRVELDIVSPPAGSLVSADRILLEQLFTNLARNGIEAMSTTAAEDRRLSIVAHGDAEEITVEVADRGTGIDPTAVEHLFMPFYTTKPEGMGMGLNICRTIVELHRGRLDFTTRPGGGTTFCVRLPRLAPGGGS